MPAGEQLRQRVSQFAVKYDEASHVWRILDTWDKWMGASFLSHDGGTYELAPYEEITEEEYNNISASFKDFDPSLLYKYEKVEVETELIDEACESGVCPIR